MSHIKYIIGFIVLFSNTLVSNNFSNNNFTIHKIYDDEIFYNFVSYENELYISSSNGIYKIDVSGDHLILFDASISGPINTIFERNNNFKIKFIELPNVYPNLYAKAITDFAYLDNNLYVIARGKLLIYNNLKYSFNSAGSVRSITDNAIGTYDGVYINGKKLNKITYTDGQIRKFDSITFVCYNGLLSFKDNIETKLYNNDNSIRTKGEYGAISDIYAIDNSKYIVISDKGIYRYNYVLNVFDIIYTKQNKIIPIRNKIDSRIKDTGEFHFIDDKRYISLNVKDNKIDIIESNIKYEIKDILESDVNGNDFYAISKNNLLLILKRTKEGLKLESQYPIKTTAHTISDYENLIFLSGNNGLSIFEKTKEKINNARILIYLFDSNDTTFNEINSDMKSFKREDLSVLLVRNKVDLKNTNQNLINQLEKFEIIEISANNIDSVSSLKKRLVNEINILNPYTDTVISNSRHYEALMKALKAIKEVNIGLKSDISGDLLSVDIRKSIEHLAEITGEITNDDVLGNIFANFCIGK